MTQHTETVEYRFVILETECKKIDERLHSMDSRVNDIEKQLRPLTWRELAGNFCCGLVIISIGILGVSFLLSLLVSFFPYGPAL